MSEEKKNNYTARKFSTETSATKPVNWNDILSKSNSNSASNNNERNNNDRSNRQSE